MSYILEALKRAERERAQAQNPVAGDAGTPSQPPTGNRNTLLKIIIAALAVNAVVIAVLVLRPKAQPATAATDSVAPAQQLAARPGIITAPAPKPPPEDEPAEEEPAVQEGVASMDDLGADDADAEVQEAPSQPISRTPAVAAVERHGAVTFSKQPLTDDGGDSDESAPEESSSAAEPVSDEQSGVVEETPFEQPAASEPIADTQPSARAAPPAAAASRAPVSPPATTSSSGMVKPLSDMSAAYQGSFPQFTLQVHVYDSSPQKRFAIIDGTRYHEGDSLPQGARIAQIVAGGLIIDFRGERVLYPIGRH